MTPVMTEELKIIHIPEQRIGLPLVRSNVIAIKDVEHEYTFGCTQAVLSRKAAQARPANGRHISTHQLAKERGS